MEQIDHDGFDHINTELTENEVSEIADRQPKLTVCVKSTEDNIDLELKGCEERGLSVKAEELLILKSNLWQGDEEIKAMAKQFDLLDMIGWKSRE